MDWKLVDGRSGSAIYRPHATTLARQYLPIAMPMLVFENEGDCSVLIPLPLHLLAIWPPESCLQALPVGAPGCPVSWLHPRPWASRPCFWVHHTVFNWSVSVSCQWLHRFVGYTMTRKGTNGKKPGLHFSYVRKPFRLWACFLITCQQWRQQHLTGGSHGHCYTIYWWLTNFVGSSPPQYVCRQI